MATVLEFAGLSPAGLNGIPATDPSKADAARAVGSLIVDLVRAGTSPRQFVTARSFENAMAAVAATGGSTNAVLHLLAIARDFGIPFTLDDIGVIADRTPIVSALAPASRYYASDLFAAGGLALVGRELLRAGLLHADERTVTGATIGDVAMAARETTGQRSSGRSQPPSARTAG